MGLVKIVTSEKQLTIGDQSFGIATAKYDNSPKFWANDYKNAVGIYEVVALFRKGSSELNVANTKHIPWYLSGKAGNPMEDAGRGVYGDGIIGLEYPNANDQIRYLEARRSGRLREAWNEFCETHLKPLYEEMARREGVTFDQVVLSTDYGSRTFAEVREAFPVQDEKVAFKLGIGIHGTNDPECIGTNISAGCIRMHNEDIVEVMSKLEIGDKVYIDTPSFSSM